MTEPNTLFPGSSDEATALTTPQEAACPSCGVSVSRYVAFGCDGVDGAPDVTFTGCRMPRIEICECGDYRHQHPNDGASSLNWDNPVGVEPCLKYRPALSKAKGA